MVLLTRGSKQKLKLFDQMVKKRRAHLVTLFKKYSREFKGNGIRNKTRNRATNAMHHSIMNNLGKPRSRNWKKVKGQWECNGCVHKK